jgi:hypothetical protein
MTCDGSSLTNETRGVVITGTLYTTRRLRKRKNVHARSPFERNVSARYPRRFRRVKRDDKVGRRLQLPNQRRRLKSKCLKTKKKTKLLKMK